jgi:hypothetical protein
VDGLILCRRKEGDQQGFVCLRSAKRDPQWTIYRHEGDPLLKSRAHTANSSANLRFPNNRLGKPSTAQSSNSTPGFARADADTLHEVYSALLKRLSLTEAHRENLRTRGLDAAAIKRGNYRSLPQDGRVAIAKKLQLRFGKKLRRVPGFTMLNGNLGPYLTFYGCPGLLIPVRDSSRRIVALKVRQTKGSPRYLYISSTKYRGPGPGSPVHVPVNTPKQAECVRLTEGELKADVAAALSEIPTISIPGANSWRPALDVLPALGCKTVRLALDMDAREKPAVARALVAFAAALRQADYAVELEQWDSAHKGIDDALAAGGELRVLKGRDAREAITRIALAAGVRETYEGDAPQLKKVYPTSILRRLKKALQEPSKIWRLPRLLVDLAGLSVQKPSAYAEARDLLRGAGVRMRDFDRAIKKNVTAAIKQAPPEFSRGETGGFFEAEGCLCRTKLTPSGPAIVSLAKFTARIFAEIIRDDGAERRRSFRLDGCLASGRRLAKIEVSSEEFIGAGWVLAKWGADAIVWPGEKNALPAAIQALSDKKSRETIYEHSGWRRIKGQWVYLHAGGAIGQKRLVTTVAVSLAGPLARFILPAPPKGEILVSAVRASLAILDLTTAAIAFPLLSGIYRAVLGPTDFGLHVAGPTGVGKSEFAALCQQHFGRGLDARNLPANWASTANALEAMAFAAKDALIVVDDFAPNGSQADVARYHREADRLFRAQGNRAGRQRMRADATLRPTKWPRGLVLSTGEDIPRGESLRARLLVLELTPGALDFTKLTAAQKDAVDGKYATALAGFVQWLAPQYQRIRKTLAAKCASLRSEFGSDGQHARTPGIVADLALGLHCFLHFACDISAIDGATRDDLWRRGKEALSKAGAAQGTHLVEAEPAAHFMRLLAAAVTSGQAHVAGQEGNEPENPKRWGWRSKAGEWQAQGKRVGWVLEDDLFLEPEASFAAAQQIAKDQGESLPVSPPVLRKRLKQRGFLLATDEAREELTVRKTLECQRRKVLRVSADALFRQTSSSAGGS